MTGNIESTKEELVHSSSFEKLPKLANFTWKTFLLVFLGVVVAFIIYTFLQEYSHASKIAEHLDRADRKTTNSVNSATHSVHVFFEQAKEHSPIFAEEALGWGSKWRVVVDLIPGTTGTRSKEYIESCFKETIFSQDSLTRVLENAIHQYQVDVANIENKMLIDIQQDVPDLPKNSLLSKTSADNLSKIFNESVERSLKKAHSKVYGEIGTDFVSIMAGEVLAAVAIELGFSSGLIGAGIANSWETLGISVIASLIVDYVVETIWDWWADPKGDIIQEINKQLDNVEHLIIDGDGNKKGLRQQLKAWDDERKEMRHKVIFEMTH